MREVVTRPSPIKKVKRKRFLSKLVSIILCLIIIFISLGFLSGIKKLTINEVLVSGTESLDSSELARSVLESLTGKKLLFFSKANIFIFSKTDLEIFIKEKYPRVYKVVSIDRHGQSLSLNIEERHGAYTWCGYTPPEYLNRFKRGECYFLDQDGFAFDHAPNFSEGVYLSIYGGMPAEGEIIGSTINLQNNISDVAKMLSVLEDNDLPVHSLVLRTDGQHEFLLDTVSTTGDYAKIFWNEDSSLDDTLSKLGSALSEENFQKEFGDHSDKLLYVDTRFSNRVFYRFQDGI